MSPTRARRGRPAGAPARGRGFSLIEILIAVIILALGLLGLGAVFPAVIREQKTAQDRISGALAENNIRATLAGMTRLNQRRTVPDPFKVSTGFRSPEAADLEGKILRATYTGWDVLKEDWNYWKVVNQQLQQAGAASYARPRFVNTFDFSRTGLFETFWGLNAAAPNADATFASTGDLVLVDNDSEQTIQKENFPQEERDRFMAYLRAAGVSPVGVQYRQSFKALRIPLSARLNPAGDPDDDNPTMVWDVVARRKLETTDPRALQLAVFVRRIDPRVQPVERAVPVGGSSFVTIREQLLDPAAPVQRLPAGEDRTGLPTLDGTDGAGGVLYSGIHSVEVEFNGDPRDPVDRKRNRIVVTRTGNNADEALVAQPGQRVVDNLGNVYTVVGSQGPVLLVDPPVPASVLPTIGAAADQTSIRQLVFTPQIPVSVFIVEIEP